MSVVERAAPCSVVVLVSKNKLDRAEHTPGKVFAGSAPVGGLLEVFEGPGLFLRKRRAAEERQVDRMYEAFVVLMLLDEPRQCAAFMFEFLVDVGRIHQM